MLKGFEQGITDFSHFIAGILQWGLGHKRWIGLVVLVITASVMALFPLGFINFEFQPYIDRHEFIVQLEMPKDISMEESNALVQRAEGWLLNRPEVDKVIPRVGLTSDNIKSKRRVPKPTLHAFASRSPTF